KNVNLPFAVKNCKKGWKESLIDEEPFEKGSNVIGGKIVYKSVADAFNMSYTPVEELLGM
ncbi:MAG TPA: alanine dehydrogenase, partial [Soehngenia sp.]|nr:alanine dehydrogenase [Soehngenia sp.]